ncbi:hypothetical protein [Brevundimonas goettingensis]|uniref:Secreted protein n=1 Tax=Brevundimonas goettingensis TaxID=2774190 RepID=A0A975C119_9CAUL|nr:hypothetical protein [Brevundimonas goettingensis]QTC91064.1 hypothetical protein IFJ75_17890 [Brevundimonas goettingensis]
MISMAISMALAMAMPQQVSGANGQTLAGQTTYGPNAFVSAAANCGEACMNRQDRIQSTWVLRRQVRQLVSDNRCDDARALANRRQDARSTRLVEAQCPVTPAR